MDNLRPRTWRYDNEVQKFYPLRNGAVESFGLFRDLLFSGQ